MNRGLERRLERLEQAKAEAERKVMEAKVEWARGVIDRHFELVRIPEIFGEPRKGRTVSPADQAFIDECNAGLLEKAQEIRRQDDRDHGREVWEDLAPEEQERRRKKREKELRAKYGLDPEDDPLTPAEGSPNRE